MLSVWFHCETNELKRVEEAGFNLKFTSTPNIYLGRVVRSRLGTGVFQVRNPIPLCMWACCTLNHTQWPKVLSLVWRGSLERVVPVQVSSSSSDRGSKLRGPSQNSPRVASKQDVNITKV
ncbi:hypothetical protein AVEN_273488-1 [Araneus ventricosus]|uniref:Uncharacterized protein n=1 Tax=Araneus ventricosus TaxID=182803 RepID=A0A4Y2W7Y9_ARAVE|nr:hypothetical protein AVEN_273488-1 [Araneus ventricosus]